MLCFRLYPLDILAGKTWKILGFFHSFSLRTFMAYFHSSQTKYFRSPSSSYTTQIKSYRGEIWDLADLSVRMCCTCVDHKRNGFVLCKDIFLLQNLLVPGHMMLRILHILHLLANIPITRPYKMIQYRISLSSQDKDFDFKSSWSKVFLPYKLFIKL